MWDMIAELAWAFVEFAADLVFGSAFRHERVSAARDDEGREPRDAVPTAEGASRPVTCTTSARRTHGRDAPAGPPGA